MNDLELSIVLKNYNDDGTFENSLYEFIFNNNLEDEISLYDLTKLYALAQEQKSVTGDYLKIDLRQLRNSFSIVTTSRDRRHASWERICKYFKHHPEVINMTLKQIDELNIS